MKNKNNPPLIFLPIKYPNIMSKPKPQYIGKKPLCSLGKTKQPFYNILIYNVIYFIFNLLINLTQFKNNTINRRFILYKKYFFFNFTKEYF